MNPRRRRLLFVVNPFAAGRRAGGRWGSLREALHGRGVTSEEVSTRGIGHGAELARRHAAEFDAVVAVGGDGTVREVATGLVASGATTCLGIVPTGTGNDVARQVGIRNLEEALETLASGRSRPWDTIEVAHGGTGDPRVEHALLFASVGFAGELLRLTTPRVKRYCGRRLSYSVGFLRALGSYVAPRMKVRVDQTEHEGRFFHVSAGNTEWAGGGMMRLSPGAIPDDGLLQVCLVEALRWWEALWQFPHLVRGTFPGRRKVRYVSGSEISIWTEPPVTLQVDGDILGGTPATWKVRAGCLRVLCPRAG